MKDISKKLGLVFATISLVVLARKKNRLRNQEPEWSLERSIEDRDFIHVDLFGFDFQGSLKRHFAMQALLMQPDRSLVCSPISALMPLGKLVLGTVRGETRAELLNAIGFKQHQVKKRFRALMKRLEVLPGVNLSVVSRLYVSHRHHLSSKFLRLANSVFKFSAERVDFSSPSSSAQIINKWVNQQTKGLIPHMLSPNDISRDTSVIFINAVYFSGFWKEPFRKVTVGDFHTKNGVRKMNMMTNMGDYKYGKSKALGSEIIEIPYAGEKASFIIVLPEARSGLTLLLQQLKAAPDLLNQAMADMSSTSIRLTIPKFKIESQMDLKHLYQKIGVNTIFSKRRSGLKNIVSDDTVFVSMAKQKCVIEVFELGTEAAASTVVIHEEEAVKKYGEM